MQAPSNFPTGVAAAMSASDFLGRSGVRLESLGFRCATNVAPFTLVGHRSRIELTKFGNVDRSFTFAYFPKIELAQLNAFSAAAFHAALAARGPRLPRGFGEGVFAYAVAVVEVAPPELLDHVRNHMGPKHWSAVEGRVVFDLRSQQLAMFDGTPMWGAAYWGSERKLVRSLLG